MRLFGIGIVFFFLLGGSSVFAAQEIKLHGETMGTTWNVTALWDSSEPCPDSLREAIEQTLQKVNAQMSTWQSDSELSQLNVTAGKLGDAAPAPVPVSESLAQVLEKSCEIHSKSGGAYDVTIGPLVDLWKFGPRKPGDELAQIPSDEAIAEAKALVDGAAFRVENGQLVRSQPGLSIDLSSIAKGYGVDCVAETLEQLGWKRYMVEIGGEVRVAGKNASEKPWKIGIETPIPYANRLFSVLELSGNQALATSGDYRNFKTFEAGERFSHILDPRTGKPVEHTLVSVSVLADNCTDADGWATALMALGVEAGKPIAEREGLAVLFLEQKGQEIVPTALRFPFGNTLAGKPRGAVSLILLQVLAALIFFLIFFITVGFSHMIGRRRMMCSCKAAKVMEHEREQLLKIKKPKNED